MLEGLHFFALENEEDKKRFIAQGKGTVKSFMENLSNKEFNAPTTFEDARRFFVDHATVLNSLNIPFPLEMLSFLEQKKDLSSADFSKLKSWNEDLEGALIGLNHFIRIFQAFGLHLPEEMEGFSLSLEKALALLTSHYSKKHSSKSFVKDFGTAEDEILIDPIVNCLNKLGNFHVGTSIQLDNAENEFYSQTEDSSKIKKTIEALVMKDSVSDAEEKGIVGPNEIPGWDFYNPIGDGNCFYRAVVHQMQTINHPFLKEVHETTEFHTALRKRIQGENFQDRQWAEDEEIDSLVREFDIVLAVVDTRNHNHVYTYYYLGADGEVITRTWLEGEEEPLPTKPILRIAATGNHFLSVIQEPPRE